MGNSDTESDNECFESAEESLDENEEVSSVGGKVKKSESEVAKPVTESDNVNSTDQVEKEISGNSMSYRKRPDRVKRSNSNTTTKPLAKLPSTENIFKAEKIVPDALFHDITNNLSKNINRSLSTLQQKSSNVKDLILSTLPVSSVDREGFSYDDNTVYASPGEDEFPNAAGGFQNKNKVIESVGGEKSQQEASQKETTSINSLTDRLSCSNVDRKSAHLSTDSPEESHEENSNFKSNTLVDKITEVSDITVKETQDASGCISELDRESPKNEKECVSEKDSLLESNTFSDSTSTEILQNQQGANNKIKSVSLSHQTNEKSEIIKTPTESGKNITESDHKESHNCEKLPEVVELNQLSGNKNSLTSSEIITQDTFSVLDSKILPDDKDQNTMVEVKKETDSMCNLEELKTALENIVKDKTITLDENTRVLEEEKTKEDFAEEKVNEVQSSNDGWDDFDFSDNEIDDVEASKTNLGGSEVKEKTHEVVSDKKAAVIEKNSVSETKRCANSATKVRDTASDKDSIVKEVDSRSMDKEEVNAMKISKQVTQAEPESDDTWDWNTSWDETPDDENHKAKDITTMPKSEKIQHDSSDNSKWTGWDTFGKKSQEKQGNWSLGSWGVDMLLNKATAVTQGISTVLEAGLGAPDPETLARMEKAEREKLKELETEEDQEHSGEISKKNSLTNVNLFPVSGITSLVAGVTSKIVEHSKIQEIGSKVITGGLDTLETFGKKTMEVLQEGDPGLKNKRALLMGDNKPVLSQVLREAREKAEREMKKVEEREMAKKCHFETLFDDFQGMVHLEALEMLSRQCELKLEQIRCGMNSEEQEDLNGILEEVEQLCALDECELDLKSSVLDFKTVLQMAVEPLKNEISVHKIIQIHENTNRWLEMSSETEPSLIIVNQKLVSTLAELAAATVQQFHKSGELLSVKECRKTVEEVDALSRLTNILCTEISRLCEKFILLSQSKRTEASAESLNSLTEKVTVVMKNSTSYIKQAFDLLIPVIQLGAAV